VECLGCSDSIVALWIYTVRSANRFADCWATLAGRPRIATRARLWAGDVMAQARA